jgi:hypothetical protein
VGYPRDVRFPPIATNLRTWLVVRFVPANKRIMQRSKLRRYSIASSALACNVKGTVMPGVRTLRHEPHGRPKDGRAVAVTRQLVAT